MSDTQIYSATYSNVPVFEFVTSEGPIMRRKSDSWINATHILKIAKFPKARRTRILEKDVQTGIHEKVQGGYGKYQGTYVPLDLGATIAKNFGVYDVLKPIFEFQYIEGETEIPPPAPKHNHASALNVAKRQASLLKKQKEKQLASTATSSDESSNSATVPKKRGRPKRPTLSATPSLKYSDTTPIEQSFASNASAKPSFMVSQNLPPALARQDTEQDALQIMTNNMNLRQEDLASVDTEDDEDESANDDFAKRRKYPTSMTNHHNNNGNGLESQVDLLTSKELFGVSRSSFEKRSNQQHNNYSPLQPYHQPSISLSQENQIYSDYFQNLLTYFLDDNNRIRSQIPEKLLNPPLPLSKIHINQAIDNDGNTIFHWACSMGNLNMVEFLMKTFTRELNPDVRNNLGETPLMFMAKFNNSFQLRNFPQILNLLEDSILLVDSNGKTVLHHIVDTDNKHKREKFARYYMESLFEKMIDGNLKSEEDGEKKEVDETAKEELLSKFINHQDSNGNTAFHIAAYNLNKKCIKVFINYHRFIKFGLRNLVSCTVEDYLASHNYVLRLDSNEPDTKNGDLNQGDHGDADDNDIVEEVTENQSFEAQLHNSKTAINLQNTTANLLTEKMTQLAYAIDSELSEKDEIILTYFKILSSINEIKLESQRKILSFFKLDHLIEELEPPKETQDTMDLSSPDTDLYLDFKRDYILQEEIYRLMNDLTYQTLHKQDELETVERNYKNIKEKLHAKELAEKSMKQEDYGVGYYDATENFALATELQSEVLKRKKLVEQISKLDKSVPIPTNRDQKSIINRYSPEDKLHKYCKLISLSCGMEIEEIESSIDAIEESLVKNK
ncbi:MBP1 Transcription factor MBP1 [Candida maltosa Xu316]|uniref:Transcription factor MBP1 n=1 Tax=Candida maltosa (strain Xu316) TaxID=1245528 RepID=M3JUZ7_CANMX|nr:hypothetical protein G210_3545 [Candida maltosa Xu316]